MREITARQVIQDRVEKVEGGVRSTGGREEHTHVFKKNAQRGPPHRTQYRVAIGQVTPGQIYDENKLDTRGTDS